MKYLSKLDHIRFFAASWVILKHFNGNSYPSQVSGFGDLMQVFFFAGSSGVSIFLVLSGFLFTLIFYGGNKKIPYFTFIKKRILRIFPLLIVVVFIGITANRGNSDPIDILRLLTLQLNTGNPTTGWGADFFPIGPIWTVAVEFQFYLIFPFIILFTKQKGISYLFLLLIVVWLAKISLIIIKGDEINTDLYHSIIGRLDQFIFGMIFALVYLKKLTFKYSSILIFLTSAILGCVIFMLTKDTLLKMVSFRIMESLLFGGFIYFYLSSVKMNQYVDKAFSFLGKISYSTYLTHLIVGYSVIFILKNYIDTSSPLFTLFVIFPVVFLISSLTYFVIEKPFLNIKDNIK